MINASAFDNLRGEGQNALLDSSKENEGDSISRLDGKASSIRHPSHYGRAETTSDELQYHETASILVGQSQMTTVEALPMAKTTVLVREKENVVPDYDKYILAMAYSHLFPYGYGHPGKERLVKVSLEECCKYYFRLQNKLVSRDSSFLLVVLNLIEHQRAAMCTVISAKTNPWKFAEMAEGS